MAPKEPESQPWWGIWMLAICLTRIMPDHRLVFVFLYGGATIEVYEEYLGHHINQPLRDIFPISIHTRMCLAQMDDRPRPEVMWPEL
jgi:hypothetical protein